LTFASITNVSPADTVPPPAEPEGELIATLSTEIKGRFTVMADEVRVPVATPLPEYASEPDAEPENVREPADVAV
jgi:hypothetical protein